MTSAELIDGGLGSRHLCTPRLTLRWLGPDDASALAEYGSDPVIRRKTETIPAPYDEAAARSWLEASCALRARGEAFRFALVESSSGAFVGVSALSTTETAGVAELAFWLGRPFWGRGYGTEAVAATLAYGRDILRLNGVAALVFSENTASVAVLRGQGFSERGFDLMDVPERGGARLIRRFSLEFGGSASDVLSESPDSRVA